MSIKYVEKLSEAKVEEERDDSTGISKFLLVFVNFLGAVLKLGDFSHFKVNYFNLDTKYSII